MSAAPAAAASGLDAVDLAVKLARLEGENKAREELMQSKVRRSHYNLQKMNANGDGLDVLPCDLHVLSRCLGVSPTKAYSQVPLSWEFLPPKRVTDLKISNFAVVVFCVCGECKQVTSTFCMPEYICMVMQDVEDS